MAALLVLAFPVPSVQIGADSIQKSMVAKNADVRPSLATEASAPARIWPVEQKKDHDIYSNGLRIENRFRSPNYPRAYRVYPLNTSSTGRLDVRTEPAGIVFHTTESSQAPFEADHNVDLQRFGENTLSVVSRNHSYHFVIDRFGRVFRIVPESDAAFHAGKSLWADDHGVYIGLNDSFLGVAFEGHTQDISEGGYLDAPQILSGRLLVEMLRDKYGIPAARCITHSQVSINPGNMKIGIHTDGAGDFPFEQLGLADNYTLPQPSIYLFGFDYDLQYLKSTGFRLWRGLFLADERVREDALARKETLLEYRRTLQRNYRRVAEAVEIQKPVKENE